MAEIPMGTTGPADNSHPDPTGTPQSCHWGASTLDFAFPDWLNAWETPWTCCHPKHSGPLETCDTCATCRDWTRRAKPR